MKTIKSIGVSLLICSWAAGMTSGEQFRTDINPATQYYQASLLAPNLSEMDRDYLFTKEWRGQKLPERFGELVSQYDNQFKLVRHAAQATVPCDWGIDISQGPYTLLPHLARNKAIAQAARVRVMWELQQGRPGDARDDLLAALALARNCSRDRTLIAALVQIAMENILCSVVAENFYRFSPEMLKQLADGFEAAPARGTVAACIPTEKAFVHDWLLAKIHDLQKEHPGNEAKVMAGIHDLITGFAGAGDEQSKQGQPQLWEKLTRAAAGGSTSEGIIKLVGEMEPLYRRLALITALPTVEYEHQMRGFSAEIQKSENPLVVEMFPAVEKCRPKEFAILAKLAMVQAAVEYKLKGEAGLKGVTDPCGQGPFAIERFEFQGVDRGFALKSAYAARGFQEVLIFVEKDGPPFFIDGQRAGQPLAK